MSKKLQISNYQKNHINPTGGGGVIYVVNVKRWKQFGYHLLFFP
ncbi:hypothetical protein MOCA_26160 [Moorella thermoacetica]|nr:hypothetical protein MOCA_26160 [Moorella thermoacetica]